MKEDSTITTVSKQGSKAHRSRQERSRIARERDADFTPAIVLRQTKSAIRRPKEQADHLRGLGLGRVGKEKRLPDTPSNRGRVAKIQHLVDVRFEK